MPTVPTYGDFQVRSDPLQPVYQRTPDVSSGAKALGQGLAQVGEAIDRIDYRDSQDAAFKAEAKIREDWQVQRAALRNQYKGDQADQYKAAADEWWAKARETYAQDLSPRAQGIAGRSIGQYKMAQDADTIGYVEREKATAREVNFKTLQSTLARETLQNATPETASDLATVTAQRLRENAIRYAAANGLSSDVGEAMARDQIDNLHKGIALTLASRPDGLKAAQTYISEHSKEMLPADRDQINRQIEVTAKQAKQQRESEASDTAWQLFAQGKPIPADVLGQMDGRERYQLQEAGRVRADRLKDGKTVKTDMPTYIDVREKLARGERVDLRQYTEKIGPVQMEQLLDIQTSVSKGGVKQDAMLTDEQRINNALVGLGIDKKKHPDTAGTFTLEVDRRVRAESAARGGRDLTADEKQKIVDQVSMDKVFVNEWGRDPEKPLALLKPEQLANAYVTVDGRDIKLNTIPATDRMQISEALRKRGLPVTEQQIARIYLSTQKGK